MSERYQVPKTCRQAREAHDACQVVKSSVFSLESRIYGQQDSALKASRKHYQRFTIAVTISLSFPRTWVNQDVVSFCKSRQPDRAEASQGWAGRWQGQDCILRDIPPL
ncbi:uncharacterized protein EI97DRAFT_320489 [Westerdykella ornata]|uniref:Uncharacterized protein n=1 Tax=Westerdykella ornata TaxID=318751 RepID=A0A6A6JP76_WESOR|nr:uncharacterized protein EI97DRAFT_320489 [Westerdykella ornata]KAF2276749.1 hypothetical protein EI97DRAFT_320489 [Westerdykella ornata]